MKLAIMQFDGSSAFWLQSVEARVLSMSWE